ncbi:Crp/Fnr family transcriptional regulator [Variovorax beijingensis]|uniref:Crp/Fnr family transcriptional regulator n=1 Tax=Variovorax beijingensis TaxID=2496117 RepID=A0A3P3EWQ5_9BURK|nr:Crp/Fnr family transcriptional regulator [Variovorax beijingensis]RRH89758.1 Crp/Fnr family transcriptional regulator [Variovorax beijingensis]RSZ41578.1 Crp/Fnr family transcriptional regulator [Variovorax beijingensis]
MPPSKPRLSPAHRAAMERNPWFTSMPRAQREALLGAGELIHVRRGAMVFRQGDPIHAAGGGFYGLLAGTIKISSLRQDGREAILAVLEPGNWFGEITLIDGSPRTHDATALEALDLLVVPPAAFAQQMRDVVFANAMAAMLAARVRMLYGLTEDATLRSLRARVAHRLLVLARGDATQSVLLRRTLMLPQEALAMMLGVTRQTLSKELNALAGEGVLALGYGRIELRSLDALQALVSTG